MNVRRNSSVSLLQAVEGTPSLLHLSQMVAASAARLKVIQSVLPKPMQGVVQSGGLEDGCWCLLAPNNAVAAKLRQLSPSLLEVLHARGHAVEKLRIKIVSRG